MSDSICPRCRTPLPENASDQEGGVQCPRCLLRPPWEKPQPVAITLGPGQSFVPPTIEELSRHVVGYEVEALIGQGGMGAVYLGKQTSLDRSVAIKILPPQIAERPGFRERFGREGRALAKLNHPNIVAVHDFGQAGPYAMLVMELVEGANLREVLTQGKLAPAEALEIIPQLCDALSYAHDEGVVHRDIKPENLLFDGRGRLKITDFGLAKLVASKSQTDSDPSDDQTQQSPLPDPTRGVVGTVHYMAPEQLENPTSVDHRADIYALGVVFYEMLTGELPIGRFEPPSRVVADHDADQPSRVAIDVRLDEVVLRALEKHPEKRYGSAADVMHDIDDINQHPVRTSRESVIPEVHRRRVRETVHRAGEAAGRFASSSIEATGSWVSHAKTAWIRNPRVEIPAYFALVTATIGGFFTLVALNDGGDEEVILSALAIAGFLSFVFARISLSRETEADRDPPPLMSRMILGVVYLAIAVPLLLAPIVVTFLMWIEIYGTPRDVGRPGWLTDWTLSIAFTTIVTAACWFGVILFHSLFPKVLTAVFHPFARPMSRRTLIAATIVLLSLIGTGWIAMRQTPYLPYTPGLPVAEEDWPQLSPRDLKDMQSAMREQDRKLSDQEFRQTLEEYLNFYESLNEMAAP